MILKGYDSINDERLILIFTDKILECILYLFSYFNELESLKSER